MKNLSGNHRLWIMALAAGTVVLGGMGLAMAQEAETETVAAIQVDMAFGTGVDPEDRTLMGAASIFAADLGKVFCYTTITGMADVDTVTHAWYYEGRTMARVDLAVKAAHWRTWSSKRVLPGWTGHWEVKILDRAGKVLASDGFELE